MVKTQNKHQFNVDLSVLMPPSCFKDKDLKNHKYFDKRALYLAVLAEALVKEPTLKLEAFRGDIFKPILSLKPKTGNFILRIHLAIKPAQFSRVKLLPNKR